MDRLGVVLLLLLVVQLGRVVVSDGYVAHGLLGAILVEDWQGVRFHTGAVLDR